MTKTIKRLLPAALAVLLAGCAMQPVDSTTARYRVALVAKNNRDSEFWDAVFTGADIAFQDIQLHTHRNKSELHFMAGHTMLSIPLASILSIEKLVLRDIQSIEYEIITKEGGTITLDVF